MKKLQNKTVVILGPTASGKSWLGIRLAKKFGGEIISADSRQVYKGMDLGTGKVSKAEQKIVPHHLLDVANPNKQFTVSDFVKLASKEIGNIRKRGKIPFVVGGTAFYIYSLMDGWEIPEVKPDKKLRAQLEKKSAEQLFAMLAKLDKVRAADIDRHNKVRLIRAVEIVKTTGRPVPQATQLFMPNKHAIYIGIKIDQDELYDLIDKRLEERLDAGMLKEVMKLKSSGLSWKKIESFGLEYKFCSLHLQKKLTREQMVAQLKNAIHRFAKRQMTWFKRDKRIKWVKDYKEAEKILSK